MKNSEQEWKKEEARNSLATHLHCILDRLVLIKERESCMIGKRQ